MSRFVTKINWEFHRWTYYFNETDFIEPVKYSVSKILFKFCTISSSLLDLEEIDLSSRRSITSYSEYAREEDTINFISEFCEDYQYANRWLLMLTKQFTPDQLYEIQLRYKGKSTNGESQTMDIHIIKEQNDGIDEDLQASKDYNELIRRNERGEIRSSSDYKEDSSEPNFYAMFNSVQFSHSVYIQTKILDPKFFILALFESKHCFRLEINWDKLKVDLTKKIYKKVNFHDQQMRHLTLRNWEIVEELDGVVPIK